MLRIFFFFFIFASKFEAVEQHSLRRSLMMVYCKNKHLRPWQINHVHSYCLFMRLLNAEQKLLSGHTIHAVKSLQLFTTDRQKVSTVWFHLLQLVLDMLLTGPLLALSKLVAAAHCPSSLTWELANRSLCAPSSQGLKLKCPSQMSDKTRVAFSPVFNLFLFFLWQYSRCFFFLVFKGWVWGTCSMSSLMRASLFFSPVNVKYADTWRGQRGLLQTMWVQTVLMKEYFKYKEKTKADFRMVVL